MAEIVTWIGLRDEERTQMGKGDRRTRRGKIWARSYGKARPRPGKKKKEAPEVVAAEA